MVVIAGPNGSGKSTLTDALIEAGIDLGIYINADAIATTLSLGEPERSAQAQAMADRERERRLASRIDFSFETVMSHPSKVELMARAVAAGYEVILYFVCTSRPEINVARVANRVAKGGHDVPVDRIVARYTRTLSLLARAASIAARTVLFDNSALFEVAKTSTTSTKTSIKRSGLSPVGEVRRSGNSYDVTLTSVTPDWMSTYLLSPLADLAREANGSLRVIGPLRV
ncbi:zeta toxin family protein [Rhodopseudomonas palustris]|nr:zeta toxin family protein [Rhodopseudomonas palustris]